MRQARVETQTALFRYTTQVPASARSPSPALPSTSTPLCLHSPPGRCPQSPLLLSLLATNCPPYPPPFLYYPRLPLTATHRPPFPTPYSPFPTVPLWVHLHPSRHPLSSIPHPHSAPTPLFPIPHCPLIDTPPPLLAIHCPPFPTLSLEENKCFRTLVSNFLILICYLF